MRFLAGLLIGLAVFLGSWPFVRSRFPSSRRVQVRRHSGLWHKKSWLNRWGSKLGLESADQLCQHAGRPFGITGLQLFQYQWMIALVATVVIGTVDIEVGLVSGVLAWFMPRVLLSLLAQQRRAQIALELPAFLDLWGLLVAAGEGVETALVEICRRHPNWLLSAEIRRAVDRMNASGLFGESLIQEARVTGSPELLSVAEQIAHLADGGGVPSKELSRMAAEMRDQRITELIQAAGVTAVMGIFPKLFAVFLSLVPVIGTIVLTVIKQL